MSASPPGSPPNADYIDQAASALVPLCKSAGVTSLMWDGEGPWVHGVGSSKPTQSWWDSAADLIGDKFSGLSCPMSVTSYIDMEADALLPLTKICSSAFPQAYSSEGYPYKPGEAQTVAWNKWTDEFAKGTSLELQMGLTSYKQSGIPGFTVEQAMTTAADTSTKLGATSLCYWKLSFFTDSEVAAAMKEITGV